MLTEQSQKDSELAQQLAETVTKKFKRNFQQKVREIKHPDSQLRTEQLKYVAVEIFAKSDDEIKVNGKIPDFIKTTTSSKTVRLISGKSYVIKIGNCPEQVINPIEDSSLSTCPDN